MSSQNKKNSHQKTCNGGREGPAERTVVDSSSSRRAIAETAAYKTATYNTAMYKTATYKTATYKTHDRESALLYSIDAPSDEDSRRDRRRRWRSCIDNRARGQEGARSLWRAAVSDQHRSQSMGGTSIDGLTRLGWTDRILTTRSGRRLPGSRQHLPDRENEGDHCCRGRSRSGRRGGSGE